MTTTLSRCAKATGKATKMPRELARLVGQFTGSDMAYDPGDQFVRCSEWGHPNTLWCRAVPLTVPTETSDCCWLNGKEFTVYEVLRVTPCQITILKKQQFHVYYAPAPPGTTVMSDWKSGDTVLAVYYYTFSEAFPKKVRKVNTWDIADLKEFQQLNTDNAIELPVGGLVYLKYDAEEGKLVRTFEGKPFRSFDGHWFTDRPRRNSL